MPRFIDRQETIESYIKEHQKLRELISALSEEQLLKQDILGEWSIKDIISHLAAWNLEAIEEVGRVLKNQGTWPARYGDKVGEEKFNRDAVEIRKSKTWKEVLQEWDSSFWTQIELMKKLTDEEWKHESGQFWKEGDPLTVYSLFAYEYDGEGHEGGHAQQILRALNLQQLDKFPKNIF